MKDKVNILICLIAGVITILVLIFWESPKIEKSMPAFSKDDNLIEVEKHLDADEMFNKKNIFKTDINTIKSNITKEQNNKIKYLLSQLSAINLFKIKEIEEDLFLSDEEKFIKIDEILKKSLSWKEYKVFRDIMDEYIYYENIQYAFKK